VETRKSFVETIYASGIDTTGSGVYLTPQDCSLTIRKFPRPYRAFIIGIFAGGAYSKTKFQIQSVRMHDFVENITYTCSNPIYHVPCNPIEVFSNDVLKIFATDYLVSGFTVGMGVMVYYEYIDNGQSNSIFHSQLKQFSKFQTSIQINLGAAGFDSYGLPVSMDQISKQLKANSNYSILNVIGEIDSPLFTRVTTPDHNRTAFFGQNVNGIWLNNIFNVSKDHNIPVIPVFQGIQASSVLLEGINVSGTITAELIELKV
jgi:hypothetical protein